MLSNIQRIRLYSVAIIAAVIIIGIFFNINARRSLSDVKILNQMRDLSYSLEQYKQLYWRYPSGNRVDLRKEFILSENGFAPGQKILYHGKIISSRPVTYEGNEDSYTIAFSLKNRWPENGLTSTKCTIRELYALSCSVGDDEKKWES